jgi:GNAT superfamily N-acetyltransferase
VDATVTEPHVAEVTAADATELNGLLAVWRAVDAEVDPDDPPIPAQELQADLFAAPTHHRKRVWLATAAGEAAGLAVVEQQLDGVNDSTLDLQVLVPPTRRRVGVGRALAAVALPAVVEAGGTSLLGWPLVPAGAAFCRSLGMTHRQDDRCSRLRLADIDDEQQRRWRDDAPARAVGYRLAGWVGVCPDEWAEALAAALAAMADEPLDDIEWDPQVLTPAQVQDRERSWDAQGYDVVSTLVLAPDGSAAGASQLLASRLRPMVGAQADTGVLAAHRGHALGRWLKSENLRLAREHQPDLAVVQTFNAESNPHMLAINVEMGFRPHHTFSTYQGSVAEALAAVGLG